ncbi:MAG: response regulator [Bacilli bacterium]|nr:response regulator [Bacilli bacterium]
MKDVNLLTSNGVDINSSLELFGDMETYNETLEDFLNSVDEKINDIKKYKELSDMPNYAILVHSLKSDARYLGFTKLAELSYNHEMESKKNNVNYVYDHYEELMEEANRIINLVKSYMGQEVTIEQPKKVSISDKAILVVDDSNIIRNLISKIFNDEYGVLTADDGKQALDIIATSPDNLIGMLLDLNMPNVNGFEVLEYFKNNNLFNKIPVSIITGDDSKDTVQKAFNYPIVDVLVKPFNERDVKRVVSLMINFK